MKRIYPNNIFYIKHLRFRDLLFYRGFEYSLLHPLLDWIQHKYNKFLDNKTYYVISGSFEFIYDNEHTYTYTYRDKVRMYKEKRYSGMLTNLLVHFDTVGDEVYEINESEKESFLVMRELVS